MTKKGLTITHSEAKTWKNCQYEHDLRYKKWLSPKRHKRPLELGSWVHKCLEHYYRDGGWRQALEQLVDKEWTPLFDEERTMLGDLPHDTETIMRGYDYRYRKESWELVMPPEVDFEVTIETKNTAVKVIGRVDLVVRDAKGSVWCVDHKTSLRIPEDSTFRSMDPQLSLYPWALEQQYGVKCDGTMYNFLRTKAPTKPKKLKNGGISRIKINTTPIVFVETLKELGLDPKKYMDELEEVKKNQSYFFWRYLVPRSPVAVDAIVRDLAITALYIDKIKTPVRNITSRCEYCSFLDLCYAQMHGQDTDEVLRHFEKKDPYKYLGLDEYQELEMQQVN